MLRPVSGTAIAGDCTLWWHSQHSLEHHTGVCTSPPDMGTALPVLLGVAFTCKKLQCQALPL